MSETGPSQVEGARLSNFILQKPTPATNRSMASLTATMDFSARPTKVAPAALIPVKAIIAPLRMACFQKGWAAGEKNVAP